MPIPRSRVFAGRVLVAAVVVSALSAGVSAQDEPLGVGVGTLEAYLDRLGLRELLVEHLRDELTRATGQARLEVASRLGSLYVQMLADAPDAAARERWEVLSRELLAAVPEADSFDLRLNLAKVRYLTAEELAEKHRLRLASTEERHDAERTLRQVYEVFKDVGAKVNRRVEQLERLERRGGEEDTESLQADLAESRRLRSLAMYYSGWTAYYLAYLTDRPEPAVEAQKSFGWLLNAPGGRPASVERAPEALLRYEHVARAAIGCALCASLRGNDVEAERWLDLVEKVDELPPVIREQLLGRRLVVLSAARRWLDMHLAVRRALDAAARAEPDSPGVLRAGDARLLGVLSLEGLTRGALRPRDEETLAELAQIALSSLVRLGEVAQVRDLVARFGTSPIGGDGFIVQYVRGMQAYERARAAHAAAAGTPGAPDEPTSVPEVANEYREAAGPLRAAVGAADAARFPKERSGAATLLGLALYYAGDFLPAAEVLADAASSAPDPGHAEQALYLAVVALDAAVTAGDTSAALRRDELALLYLSTYPDTERAARLLLRRAAAGTVSDEQAVEVLLRVGRESRLYAASRRQAAVLLYRMFRSAQPADRDYAALRFLGVADELLAGDTERALGASSAELQDAVHRVVTTARQVLDAALARSAPDVARAQQALQAIDGVLAHSGLRLAEIADELEFRRLQVALALRDGPGVDRAFAALRESGGRFAEAAERLLYRDALSRRNRDPDDTAAAIDVVRFGSRIIEREGSTPEALGKDSVYTLHDRVADAAAHLWRVQGSEFMRDEALRIDRALLASGRRTQGVVRRAAEVAEAAGDVTLALECWNTLVSGIDPSREEWFEARWHSLRLMAATDPTLAMEVLRQHLVFHPALGPEPWGSRLRELAAGLGVPAEGGGSPR